MTPQKQRPGFAALGQYVCRKNEYDPDTGHVIWACNKPVPEGELTHLALNSPGGDYLVLCRECRAELAKVVQGWASASQGKAKLLAELRPLTTGQLVSETDLRAALVDAEVRSPTKRGPLSRDEVQQGLALLEEHPPRA